MITDAKPSALTGIRVVEFGPYVALPLTGRILGSLGAEVIKVETNWAYSTARRLRPVSGRRRRWVPITWPCTGASWV